MPTISRAKRHKARIKRSNSLLKRGLQQAMFQSNKNFSLLVAVLTQLGHETLISKETLDSVMGQLGRVTVNTESTDAGLRVYTVAQVSAADLPAETLDQLKVRMDAAHNDVPAYQPPAGSVTAQVAAERDAVSFGDAADLADAPSATDPA